MNETFKKVAIVGLSVVTAVGLSGFALYAPAAQAQSTADLQAQIQALLAQIAALQAQLNAQAGGSASGSVAACNFARNLTVGSQGDDVKCLQQYLNSAGYPVAQSGVGSAGSETTYFGSLTNQAVVAWQNANAASVLQPVGLSAGTGFWGPSSISHYNSLASAGGVGTGTGTGSAVGVAIPADGLAISLAAGNPAPASIPQGASNVEYLRFNVAGDGVLNSLTVKREGLGGSNDFDNVYLYEGNRRLTSARTVNSTTHEVFFAGLNLDVRNEVRTFRLVVDVSSSNASAGEESAFRIVEAVSSEDVSGLPVVSNTMEIAGASVGSISVSATSSPSNPSVGQNGARLADFQLSAGTTEDVKIKRLALTEGGNENDSYLSNFELRVGGNVIATASGVENELVTFVFDTPYVLEKGEVETFRVYGDISGNARNANTIVFYFETNSDIEATGATYGYPVTTTITNMDTSSEGATLTLQAGQVTIAFDGPSIGDISKNGQDVTLFEYSMTSKNNVEVRNTRFSASLSGRAAGEDFTDFKLWDADAGRVITSATTIGTTTTATFTDNYNINAGETRNFRVTADVDTDFDDGDSITVTLSAFQANDIKNLDNNTFVATTDIVGDNVAGNAQSVRVPSLDVQLSGTPTSQTYVRGVNGVDLVGFTFRAVADDIEMTELKIYATSSSGTIVNSDLQSLKLIDADNSAQLGDTEALDSSLTATFNNFTLTVNKGQTKTLYVRANLSSNITNGDQPYVYINALNDVTARDSDGNTLTSGASGLTGSTANSGGTIAATITTVGDVTVVTAPDDVDSEAGLIVMDGERTLAKFRFTAASETMTVQEMDLLLNNDNTSATATSSAVVDEVSTLKLYDGTSLLKSVPVQGSGASTGVAFVRSLGWLVPKDTSKTLTVKGVVNSSSAGADSGQEVAVHVMAAGFKAEGSTSQDTSVTAASGNEKFVFKTKPTITVADPGTTLQTGEIEVLRFTVAADSNEQLAWRKVQLKVSMTDATMSAVASNPAATGNFKIRDISGSSYLNIATGFSGSTATASTTAAITGGNTGYVTAILNAEQAITAGSSKQYGVYLTFADVDAGGNSGAAAVVSLYQDETTVDAADTFVNIENGDSNGVHNGTPSFIWSDYSVVGHSLTTADWANSKYVKELPSSAVTVSQ